MIKAVLFDLDGTLLPMDQDVFFPTFFERLCDKLAEHGYDRQGASNALWKGVELMKQTDGSITNEDIYWNCFKEFLGDDILQNKDIFNQFYKEDFPKLQTLCGYNPQAAACVREVFKMGYRIVLATNPMFPAAVTHGRLRWTGLEPEEFEWVTTYEDNNYCKPHYEYYRQLLEKLNLKGEECLLVGNDTTDDMSAQALGIHTFLITDCIVNKYNLDISQWPNGSFPELMEYIRRL